MKPYYEDECVTLGAGDSVRQISARDPRPDAYGWYLGRGSRPLEVW